MKMKLRHCLSFRFVSLQSHTYLDGNSFHKLTVKKSSPEPSDKESEEGLICVAGFVTELEAIPRIWA
ncbi:MAG TPA: hypothetical protein VJT54_12075 [Verrucomicrobiae bacterium]|nr:hypothetical protein [Verrucomicrobiae bacterium]